MNQEKTILICPLNWGLGHATRCVPIIESFLENNYKVIVATESPLTEFFQERFPEIEMAFLPGPKITYHHKGSLARKIISQIPRWAVWTIKEKQLLKELVKIHLPFKIISDNRYGIRMKNIPSILITHQLMIKLPTRLHFFEGLLHRIIRQLILRFDECWIPDEEMALGLSGDLSHKYPLPKNAKFIGIQSRFMIQQVENEPLISLPNADILVILSGPEPQKNILKEQLIRLLLRTNYSVVMITGDPNFPNSETGKNKNLTFFSHLSQNLLKQLIEKTPIIISRSGYSSIMDFWYLQKNAILIPTPGQTEQEYLAQHLEDYFSIIPQNKLNEYNLKKALSTIPSKNRIPKAGSKEL